MDCLLHGFGTNDDGELGSKLASSRWIAPSNARGVMWYHVDPSNSRPCPSVRTAGCGNSFSVIALDANEVLSCGSNECGQLGIGATEDESVDELQVLPQLEDEEFVEVACGFDHTVCLTKAGRVWAWGEKSSGQLGIDNDMTSTPQAIASLSALRVVALAAGASHSLMVLEDGALLSFGSNLKGQLGIGFASEVDDHEGRSLPRKVLIPEGESVACCAGGGMHSLALTQSGRVLAWGCNTFCQAGDAIRTEVHAPTEVLVRRGDEGGHVRTLACGFNHSVVLTSAGAVFSFGRGKHGLLCNGAIMDCASPQRADALRGHVVDTVSCGCEFTLALVRDGPLFVWGNTLVGRSKARASDPGGRALPPLEVPLPDPHRALHRAISGSCASHTLLLYRPRISWARERVLWLGLLKGGPQCPLSRLPKEHNTSSAILRSILTYAGRHLARASSHSTAPEAPLEPHAASAPELDSELQDPSQRHGASVGFASSGAAGADLWDLF
mmetsp:Transcript_15896/g.37727  ORF Transcript_15896/g.37727 Transcript_15896/m.37727 type:complete len:498 (-) Transcript_15896:130-1623(-)